jgi:hypothetical protein
MFCIAVNDHKESGFGQPPGGYLGAVHKRAGGADDADMAGPNCLFQLRAYSVGAGGDRAVLYVGNIPARPSWPTSAVPAGYALPPPAFPHHRVPGQPFPRYRWPA